MTQLLPWFLFLSGFYPLTQALWSNRRTTLRQPLNWAFLAWAFWTGVAWYSIVGSGDNERLTCYGALCLTGCAGVAVLGARRPGTTAWNFVVVGLLVVLLMPIVNGWGDLRLEPAQAIFLTAVLTVSFANYLPTRLGPAALATAAGCGFQLAHLIEPAATEWMRWTGLGLLMVGPWTAWAMMRTRGTSATQFDRLWLAYRDRFGFVWGQRMREQFNRAAHHAGWSVVLHWSGLHSPENQPPPDTVALLSTLRAVLKRFMPEE